MKGKIPEKLYKACGGDSTWSSYGVSNREYGWQKFVEIDLEKITLRRLERLRDMIAPYTASIRGTKTLVRDIETWIRVLANEKTGITARTVEQPLAGTRLRRVGKGRSGLHITVKLVRNGQLVCDVDTSQTYRTAREVEEWLADWKGFDRKYHGAPAPKWNQIRVDGEPHPHRGKPMTVCQLKALDSGSLVWVKVKESGEEFARVDGPCVFTREAITRCMFTQKYAGMDFDLNDSDVPKSDDAKLAWEDGDGTEIRIHHVRLVPYFYVETRKTS